MARRRKSSTVEDLMDLVALLPWWAGVVLALASYWVLDAIAKRPLPAAQSAQQIGQWTTTAIWQGLATGGQYLLPMICLFGALMSWVRRRQRREARGQAEASPSVSNAAVPHGTAASAGSAESAGIVQAMEPTVSADPSCPKCGEPMVRRVAKRGTAAGKAFWGCSEFSAGCRGTREIQSP